MAEQWQSKHNGSLKALKTHSNQASGPLIHVVTSVSGSALQL